IVKKVLKKKSPVEGGDPSDGGLRKVVRKKKVDSEEGAILHSNGKKGEEGNERRMESNGGDGETIPPSSNESSERREKGENGRNGAFLLSNGDPERINASVPPSSSLHNGDRNGKKEMESSDDEDIATKLRREIMERERLKGLGEDPSRRDSLIRRPSSRSPTRSLSSISESRPRSTRDLPLPPSDLPIGRSGTFMKPRSFSPVPPSIPISTLSNIPVIALQIVLRNHFSYEELGRLRGVHPHWDEICGQLLNGGYYSLLERTDRMLMKYQRRAHSDSGLHYAVALLTNIQVHILNPVDIMRAALDEGICCFPYGVIIDRTLVILDEIEKMVEAGEKRDIGWEGVAVLAKRASSHYRNDLEEIMEERMGTCARLKAAQRIIRMDSMIVEHNVNKLEKESVRARDDLRWELEQVQQSNGALRKENRQLKADQMRLESRIESLENKLRSICRLLS
ncbi:hypothetical protein PMAYCL1PPCAC_23857, partial [Pristionchus mayeri]